MTAQISQVLCLLQMSDSALPIGGYSNSWGMETWVQDGVLVDAAAVKEALQALLVSSIAPNEGVACSLAHRFACDNDDHSFRVLNDYLTAGRWCDEPLAASLNMGERLIQLSLKTGWLPKMPAAGAHHCAVFGWLAGAVGIPREQAVAAYLYSCIGSLVSACVRLVPLGHTDGQRILTGLKTTIESHVPGCLQSGLDDLGGFAPMNEWACKKHETLYSRLFQS